MCNFDIFPHHIPTIKMQFLYSENDNEDRVGNCKKGSFHTDLYIGEIPDEVIEDPSPALLPLFYKED